MIRHHLSFHVLHATLLALLVLNGCTLYREKAPAPDPPRLPETKQRAPANPGKPSFKGKEEPAGVAAIPSVAALETGHETVVQPPPPPPEKFDFFDPRQPCFSRGEMARARRTLFNGHSQPEEEPWTGALNRVFFETGVDCRDMDFLVLVLSTIQQESGVSVDPPLENANLEKLLEFRLNRLGKSNPLMKGALDASGLEKALRAKVHRDGRRGKVKSEGDLARYVEQDLRPWMQGQLVRKFSFPQTVARMAADLGLPNPVRTIGPLQVNLFKAFRNARDRGDPVATPREMRNRLLDPKTALVQGLREGVYLLWEPYRFYKRHLTPEESALFAGVDFNAGEFSSRNAAFQERTAELSGRKLTLDGDLLLYRNGRPLLLVSQTERGVREVFAGSEPGPIRDDLALEKKEAFSETRTAKRVCDRYRELVKKPCLVARIPGGAANDTARMKLGRSFTPKNYARGILKRFRVNRELFQKP